MALIRIGLISDTHGRLDPRALEIFERETVEAIVHAGDIGGPDILWGLTAIAPVTAVLGNNDHAGVPGWMLDPVAQLALGGHRLAAVHVLGHLKPIPDDVHVVVHGHTHVATAVRDPRSGALCVNPGSVSRPRAGSGKSVGLLTLDDARVGNPDAVQFEVVRLSES